MPDNPARHSTSNQWAATIDAILAYHGQGRFLQGIDAQMNLLDSGYEWMLELAQFTWELPPAFADAWVSRAENAGLSDRFKDKFGRERSPRAKSTIMGTILNEYAGRVFRFDDRSVKLFQDYRRGIGHKPMYSFVLQQGGK